MFIDLPPDDGPAVSRRVRSPDQRVQIVGTYGSLRTSTSSGLSAHLRCVHQERPSLGSGASDPPDLAARIRERDPAAIQAVAWTTRWVGTTRVRKTCLAMEASRPTGRAPLGPPSSTR